MFICGEAIIISGRSQSVNRIRGLLSISGKRRDVIGVFAFNRGRVKKANKKEVFKE